MTGLNFREALLIINLDSIAINLKLNGGSRASSNNTFIVDTLSPRADLKILNCSL